MATIDVRKTDEFAARSNDFYQLRGDEYRLIGFDGASSWVDDFDWHGHRTIPHAQALSVIRAMGHTVDEVEAEPEPVRVTHAIESKGCPGLFDMMGTREGAEAWVKRNGAGDDYRVVPIVMGGA